MAHLNGVLLIDAPASALNNARSIRGERAEIKAIVKTIRTKEGAYPYVSAQAFRYWLRSTLEQAGLGWKAAPIYREKKVAYTDANPILWWDDDLFGYARLSSKQPDAVELRQADETHSSLTPVEGEVTRISPFKMSPLVSVAQFSPTDDFGVMSRQEGHPVLHEHQFYRTTLKGLFGLDVYSTGTFWHRQKTGYRNLDDHRKQQAEEHGLDKFDNDRAYRLSKEKRVERMRALLQGMALLDGGANQALHYTNVAPSFVLCAVTKGGNNPFGLVVGANQRGEPQVNIEALEEALDVFSDQLLSPLYVGWIRGFMDDQRADIEEKIGQRGVVDHPRRIFERIADDFANSENSGWLE